MPWKHSGSGFTTKDRGGFVKNPGQYEKLRAKGMSKERAARITNSVNKGAPMTLQMVDSAIEVDKADNRKTQGGAAIGAGGALAGVGALGGGVPGTKATRLTEDIQTAHTFPDKAKAVWRSQRAGNFGYRQNAHHTHKVFGLGGERTGDTNLEHLKHGFKAGQIDAEDKIIRHMKVAGKGANAALIGGVGLAGLGGVRLYQGRKKKVVAKADRNNHNTAFGTALGAGAAGTGLTVGGSQALEHHGRKWSQQAADALTEAGKIHPDIGGYKVNPIPKKVKNKRVPDIGPANGESKIQRNKNIMSSLSTEQAAKVGHLRGNALKSRYFAGIYGATGGIVRHARIPAVAAAGVGAGGLAWNHHKKVQKSLFDISKAAKKHMSTDEATLIGSGTALGIVGGVGAAEAHGAMKSAKARQGDWEKNVSHFENKADQSLHHGMTAHDPYDRAMHSVNYGSARRSAENAGRMANNAKRGIRTAKWARTGSVGIGAAGLGIAGLGAGSYAARRHRVKKGLLSGATKLLKVGNGARAGAVGAKNAAKSGPGTPLRIFGSKTKSAPVIGPTHGPVAPTGQAPETRTTTHRGLKQVSTLKNTNWGPNGESVHTNSVITGRHSNPFWNAKTSTRTTTTVRDPANHAPKKFVHNSEKAGHLTGFGRASVIAGGGATAGGVGVMEYNKHRPVQKSLWAIAKAEPDQADLNTRKRNQVAGGVGGAFGGVTGVEAARHITSGRESTKSKNLYLKKAGESRNTATGFRERNKAALANEDSLRASEPRHMKDPAAHSAWIRENRPKIREFATEYGRTKGLSAHHIGESRKALKTARGFKAAATGSYKKAALVGGIGLGAGTAASLGVHHGYKPVNKAMDYKDRQKAWQGHRGKQAAGAGVAGAGGVLTYASARKLRQAHTLRRNAKAAFDHPLVQEAAGHNTEALRAAKKLYHAAEVTPRMASGAALGVGALGAIGGAQAISHHRMKQYQKTGD